MKKSRALLWAVSGLLMAGISMETAAQTEAAEWKVLVEDVHMSESQVELGGSQRITIDADGLEGMEEGVLEYKNHETGEVFTQNCTEVTAEEVVFDIFFEHDASDGAYELENITFEKEDDYYTYHFEEEDEVVFYVYGEGAPMSGVNDSEDSEIQFWTNGIEAAYSSLERGTILDTLVIVLDPGHDNTHAGAYKNGLREEKLNLAIALYCKEELEKYARVKVYLTRPEDGSCPYEGTTASKCNEKRVEFAKSVDADIFVSLHNNSSTGTAANGAIVYYPNTNYKKDVSDTAKGLARKIQDRLVALGLYNNGISMKYSADYTYPDGSTADYYAIIRNGKLKGIPAIIVEHAFMSNAYDAQNFLSSGSRLKALGVADAKAIVEYYSLQEAPEEPLKTPQITMYPIVTQAPIQTPAEGQTFVDVYDDWYSEYIQYVYDRGIMNGIRGTFQFQPGGNVTKAQVAQVLYNMEGMPEVTDRSACTDLKDVYEDWFTDAVCWAYSEGIVTGDKVTLMFSPNANVKREELALMLYRYAKAMGYTVDQTSDFAGLKNAYKISSWALDGMKWAVGADLIGGIELKNSAGEVVGYDLKPQGTATRAQLAAILTRFCEAYD